MIRKMIYHVNNNVVCVRERSFFTVFHWTSFKTHIIEIAHRHTKQSTWKLKTSSHWLPIFTLDFTGTINKRERTEKKLNWSAFFSLSLFHISSSNSFHSFPSREPLNWIKAHVKWIWKCISPTHIQTHLIKRFLLIFPRFFFFFFSVGHKMIP